MNKKEKEFLETFWNPIEDSEGELALMELDDDATFLDIWQWIEQYGTEQRLDELEKLIFDITDDLDNATIFEDATRAYGLKYARTTAQNRIKGLNETLIK